MRLYFGILSLLLTSVALAHTGHGNPEHDGFLHLFTEPEHLPIIIACVFALLLAMKWFFVREK